MKNFKISGGMLVFLGALFWSLNAPLVKFINVDALLTAGCRATIAGVVLLPFLRPKKLNWSPWMLVYLAAYCGLSVGIVLALRATSSAIAIGMQYASIVWLFLVNTYLTKKLDKKRLVPVIMISVGVILFMMTGLEGSTMVGNLIALTESISFAFMTVGVKKAGKDNVLGLTCLANLFTAFFVFAFLPPKVTDVLAFSGQDWLIIFLLGVVNVAFGYAFYNTGVARTTPQKAAVIALWEMILAPTWTAIFLREYPSLMVIVGFVIIIAGIFVDAKVDSPAKA